ncbi:response regulator [Algibacillus agarilyticus]|uniref:response regulator n=1 Tax=Algibacillus agarilyticus TaxID=2234133 RepID=UPI0018E512E6|nr:response regulator [Algibacillus agarilyticus]
MPWLKSVELGLRNELDKQAQTYHLYREYLDVGRFDETHQTALFKHFLKEKYAQNQIDIIITQDSSAAHLLQTMPDFFKATPRIFVEPGPDFLLKNQQNNHIINSQVNYAKAVNSAIELLKPKKVITIADTDHTISLDSFKPLITALQQHSQHIQLEQWVDLPLSELHEKLKAEPLTSLVLYTPIFRQQNGDALSPYQVVEILTSKQSPPLFTFWHSLFGSGVVGGYLLSGTQIGQQTAEAVIDYINHKHYKKLDQNKLSHFYYDWRQLTRFNIPNRDLPADAIIAYYQPSYYEQNKLVILSSLGIIITLSLFLAFVTQLNNKRLHLLNQLAIERNSLEDKVQKRTLDLNMAKEQAESSAKAKADFLANMSHEIRTPMNGVVGITNLLKQTTLSHKQSQYVDKINYSAQQLLVVINDILDFSKIESGNIELENHPFSLNTVVDYLNATFETLAEQKGIKFKIIMDNSVHADLIGDIVRINQILINLCSNALKFTQEGEVTVNISATENKTRSNNDFSYGLKFTVSDTGIGIATQNINRLFDEFTQADTSTTRKFGGTGLGLTISKRLCKLMQGDIEVQSEIGVGTTFTATLQLELNNQVITHGIKTLAFDKSFDVLVIDDNPFATQALDEQLQQFNLNVVCADSAHTALNLIKQHQTFSAIILDWTMPVMDGADFILKLRELKPDDAPEIIVLTAYNLDIVKRHSIDLNVAAILQKPVLSDLLFQTLHRAISTDKKIDNTHQKLDLSDVRILIAEDNEINQIVISELLTKKGATLTLVNNGEECVNALMNQDFQLILMDIHMPVMDGIAATKKIRALPTSTKANIPIVALTANVLEADIKHYIEIGMNAHAAKPIEIEALKQIILSLVYEKS